MFKVNQILVPVDFSACSRTALEHAVVIAGRFGARLELLHVYEPPYYVEDAVVQMPGEGGVPLSTFLHKQAEVQLEALVAQVEGCAEVLERCTLAAGSPQTVIVSQAQGADLIVMGTHGRTGISHLLSGSVAERVVRSAPCPVLTVRGSVPG